MILVFSEVKKLVQSHQLVSGRAGFEHRSENREPSKCMLFPFVILLAASTIRLLGISQ